MTIEQLNQDAESIIEATHFTSKAELKLAWANLTKKFAREELQKVKEYCKWDNEKNLYHDWSESTLIDDDISQFVDQAIKNLE